MQPVLAMAVVPSHPPVRTLPRHPHLLGHVRDRATMLSNTLHERATAVESQSGITVGHEDLRAVDDLDISTAFGGPLYVNKPGRSVTNVLAEYI